MAIVNKGNPRSRQITGKGPSTPDLQRAGANRLVVDEKKIWKDQEVGLYSFGNSKEETVYMRVEVANLNTSEYELSLDRDTLGSANGRDYPANHQPAFSTQPNPLILNRFAISLNQSGLMFGIPPQSRVHIALRLKQDRSDLLEFQVAFIEHAGPDRDSPCNPRQLTKTLDWIPAPTADAVDVSLFSVPQRILFWDVSTDPDRVYFRPWNVTPRAGRLPWSLSLFHHPECMVRVTNNSSFPVSVSPHLYLSREDDDGAGIGKPQEVLLQEVSLDPGEEKEWPCNLDLSDSRFPDQEAKQLRIRSVVQVFGPARKRLGDVAAPQTLNAHYQPYRSLPKDWIVLLGSLLCGVLVLLWAIWGIPVPSTPELDVKLHFQNLATGELPSGTGIEDPLTVELVPGHIKGRYDSKQHAFHFSFDRVWYGARWPFSPRTVTETFEVDVVDDKHKYQFDPLKDQKLILAPAPNEPQILGEIPFAASGLNIRRQNAAAETKKALEALNSANHNLNDSQLANAKINEAKQSIEKADNLLNDQPSDIKEKQELQAAQKKLNETELIVATKTKGDEQKKALVLGEISSANGSIQAGQGSLANKNKPLAMEQAKRADNQIKQARSLLDQIQDGGIKTSLQPNLITAENDLKQLNSDISNFKSGGTQEDPDKEEVQQVQQALSTAEHAINNRQRQAGASSLEMAKNHLDKILNPVTKSSLSGRLQSDQRRLDDIPKPPVTPAWKEAYNALLSGQFQTALKLSERDPNDAKALAIGAIAQYKLKDKDSADAKVHSAQTNRQGNTGTDAALVNLALGYGSDDPQTQMNKYNEAIQNDPSLMLAYLLKLRRLVLDNSDDNDTRSQIESTVRDAKQDPSFWRNALRNIWLSDLFTEAFYGNKIRYQVALPAQNALKRAVHK